MQEAQVIGDAARVPGLRARVREGLPQEGHSVLQLTETKLAPCCTRLRDGAFCRILESAFPGKSSITNNELSWLSCGKVVTSSYC